MNKYWTLKYSIPRNHGGDSDIIYRHPVRLYPRNSDAYMAQSEQQYCGKEVIFKEHDLLVQIHTLAVSLCDRMRPMIERHEKNGETPELERLAETMGLLEELEELRDIYKQVYGKDVMMRQKPNFEDSNYRIITSIQNEFLKAVERYKSNPLFARVVSRDEIIQQRLQQRIEDCAL